MDHDPLTTYCRNHLGGAQAAINLLGVLRDQHTGTPLGQFAAGLLAEVEEDREVLRGLAGRVGAGASGVKEVAAWLGEKVSRVKLRRRSAGELGTFEALEALGLGILGKRALWRTLAVVAEEDGRLRGMDFHHLAARAHAEYTQVEERRLEAAPTALRAAPQ
jgi:hypothetical protein